MSLPALHIWLDAARPRTLPASAAPVLMGTALAQGDRGLHWPSALAALAGALAIQIAANYANDYYDYIKGADTAYRKGPKRATQSGLATPGQMKFATALALGLAVVPGLYLVWRGGWPILGIGLLSMSLTLLYTGGPLPLGYIGIADIFVLLFFGPVAVAGTHYVQTLQLSFAALYVGLAPGLISTAILTVNNLRDRKEDQRAGKQTLAVRFGPVFARWEYTSALIIALCIIPPSVCWWTSGHWGALAAMLLLIPSLKPMKVVWSSSAGEEMNAALAETGKVLLLFSLVFSGGWIAT